MKRLLFILLTALPLLTQARKGILCYEYADGESYYTLELDTLSKRGRLCVHYVDWEYWISETAVLTLNIHYITDGEVEFDPWYYELHGHSRTHAETWNEPQSGFMFERPHNEPDFFFRYDMKNDWQRLEYGYYHFDKNDPGGGNYLERHRETLRLSRFFQRYRHVEWFPPQMTRVEKFDYNRFPEEARRGIKKERLK